jgi:hypothetical protein
VRSLIDFQDVFHGGDKRRVGRREHHEQIGDAIAFVFVIVARRLSRFGEDRRARLDDQLLRGFVRGTRAGPAGACSASSIGVTLVLGLAPRKKEAGPFLLHKLT